MKKFIKGKHYSFKEIEQQVEESFEGRYGVNARGPELIGAHFIFIQSDSDCAIKMKEGSHRIAEVTALNSENVHRTYNMKVLGLHNSFAEFSAITEDDINESLTDGNNYSVYNLSDCGNLEPDGYDEFGFPSKILAIL